MNPGPEKRGFAYAKIEILISIVSELGPSVTHYRINSKEKETLKALIKPFSDIDTQSCKKAFVCRLVGFRGHLQRVLNLYTRMEGLDQRRR